MKHLSIGIIFLFIYNFSNAQFSLDGELRPRFEFRHGYKTPKTDSLEPAYFTTQRSRINLNHTKDNLTSKISIQDYRVWGESQLKTDNAEIGVFEAYFKLKIIDNWAITVGRQAINLDNKRLFSSSNWNQIGASHDGIRLDFHNNNLIFNSLTAFNQAKVSNYGTDYSFQIDNYKFLHTSWIQNTFDNFSVANLSIIDAYQKQGSTGTDYYRLTTGFIAKHKTEILNFECRGFHQLGSNKTGQEISAYFGNIIIGKNFGENINTTIGSEYMTGNNYTDTNNTKDNAFDILYGAKHSFNGMLDYFSTPKTTKNAGLIDTYIKIDFRGFKRLILSTQYHYMMLSNHYVHENEEINSFLAHEIDFVGDLKISNIAKMQFGYGVLFGNETLDIIKEVESKGLQQYFYTMITVKPVFYKSE